MLKPLKIVSVSHRPTIFSRRKTEKKIPNALSDQQSCRSMTVYQTIKLRKIVKIRINSFKPEKFVSCTCIQLFRERLAEKRTKVHATILKGIRSIW